MLGFETIGNATITAFDDTPVITTDPWINGKPYFGSWSHPMPIRFPTNNWIIFINQNIFGFRMGIQII